MMKGSTNEVIANDLNRQDQPQDDQSALGLDTASMTLGIELADEVEQEMSDEQTKHSSHDWCCIDGCQIAVREVVSRDDQN